MKLPWKPKLPVIDLSGFQLDKRDKWMVVTARNEDEKQLLDKLLDLPALSKRLSKGLNERSRRVANKQENSVEFFSRLERIGVTPDDDFVAVESEIWVIAGKISSGWIAYICPQANYKDLEQDWDAEQVRIRKGIEQM